MSIFDFKDTQCNKFSYRICLIYACIIFAGVILIGALAYNIINNNQTSSFKKHIDTITSQQASGVQNKFEHMSSAVEVVEAVLTLTGFETENFDKWIPKVFSTNPYIASIALYPKDDPPVGFFQETILPELDVGSLLGNLPYIVESVSVLNDDGIEYTGPVYIDDIGTSAIIVRKKIEGNEHDIFTEHWGDVVMITCMKNITSDLAIEENGDFEYEYRVLLVPNEKEVPFVIYSTSDKPDIWETYNTLTTEAGVWYFQVYSKSFGRAGKAFVYVVIIVIAFMFSGMYYVQHMSIMRKSKHIEKLNKKLKELLAVDYLTDVKNRRGVYEFLEAFIPYAERNGLPVSVAMLDIDNFKEINDLMGHDGGDKALIFFADLYQKNIRASDILGRFGGDEFAFVFANCSADNAYKIAGKLREDLNMNMFTYRNFQSKITFSMGITELIPEGTVERIIWRADKGLYKAKKNGKNRIVIIRS